MANIMTKRGQLDNVVTYQHFCDTTADLANIESKYCTLGSIAIVLQGDSGGLQIYIANSDKQWNPLTSGIGGGNGGGVANLPLEIVNPSNNDVLTYDSASEKWVNKAATSGGSGGVFIVTQIPSSDLLDKTFNEIKAAFLSGASVFLSYQKVESDPDYGNTQNSYEPLVDIKETVYTNPERTNFYHVFFGQYGYYVYEANSPDDYPCVADM